MTVEDAAYDYIRTKSLVEYLNKKVDESDAKETTKIDLLTSDVIQISKLMEHYHSFLGKIEI